MLTYVHKQGTTHTSKCLCLWVCMYPCCVCTSDWAHGMRRVCSCILFFKLACRIHWTFSMAIKHRGKGEERNHNWWIKYVLLVLAGVCRQEDACPWRIICIKKGPLVSQLYKSWHECVSELETCQSSFQALSQLRRNGADRLRRSLSWANWEAQPGVLSISGISVRRTQWRRHPGILWLAI